MTQPAGLYPCLYADMVGDLFHHGHARFLRQAREMCGRLIVGIHNDADVMTYKRTPVMTMAERIPVVAACRYVDRVVPDAPLVVTEAFLDSLGAAKVVRGDDASGEQINVWYAEVAKADRLVLVPYTPHIATTDIIQRIATRFADGTL